MCVVSLDSYFFGEARPHGPNVQVSLSTNQNDINPKIATIPADDLSQREFDSFQQLCPVTPIVYVVWRLIREVKPFKQYSQVYEYSVRILYICKFLYNFHKEP